MIYLLRLTLLLPRKQKKPKSGENKTKDMNQIFLEIIDKFRELESLPEENTTVSKRIKMLIKNMFANRDSGWSKTKDLNEGGPKTKAEVQNDVQKKYERERQA